MLRPEECVEGMKVKTPLQKSVGSSIVAFMNEVRALKYEKPYFILYTVQKFGDTDEFMFCNLYRDIGEGGEDGWLDASNFSSEDLEAYVE